MLEKALNAFCSKFEFSTSVVFKILRFKLKIFLLLQCCHFVTIVAENRLLESWLTFATKAAHFQFCFFTLSEQQLCSKTLLEIWEIWLLFEILFHTCK